MTTTQNTTAYEVGTTVHVAPETLVMERNIRDAKPDADLVASIKAVGVLEPITAVLTDDNRLVVRFGHRRTLAAVEAKTTSVPVYVRSLSSVDDASEIERLVTQRDENTHREGLTSADEAGVVASLAGLGLSAAQITKKSRIPKATVQAALTVSASDMAREHVAEYDLTLDEGVVLSEFEDDPEAVIALVNAAQRGQFEHKAQELRDERMLARKRADLLASVTDPDLTVLEDGPDRTVLSLRRIRTNGKQVTEEDHRACGGHVAWIQTDWCDIDQDGNEVTYPESPEPEDFDGDETAYEAAYTKYEAACTQVRVTARRCQVPVGFTYGCKDWATHGHTDSWNHSPSKPKAADLSDEEREKAKAARKLVIDNNKAWSASEAVRREFLANFAKIKTPPKGSHRFIADAMNHDRRILDDYSAKSLAETLVGATVPKSATENRCAVIALVQVLASYEADMNKDSWRSNGTTNAVGRYLRFLASACDYNLSDVEKYAASAKTA
ncbi:ParB/RepB/Spo0J family partition protein [Nocardioides sp. Bht2]|uniref:ParB/RepB/Spo0J family partition protein n=1 Tax=Nocardioides sp. Bht2 TaxID=3392297 RepID=UPI0039B6D11E